ncbi:MAG TPA: DUF1684 domain-containing protein [Candidatus Limnocylindria bacterium]|nr:DUF1684 domain-containing protein [Candidatus Limnocylindria bacterium]
MSTSFAFLILAAATAVAPRPADPVRLAPIAADTLRRAIEKDRADTEAWLKGEPTSYLATVLRRDFENRTSLTVGSDPASDVRIDDPEIQPRHLRVTVVGDSFRVEAEPGAGFRVKDIERQAATVAPSAIGVGRYMLRLSHQRFPAIIVFDPKSPRYREYKGLEYFPVDFSYRYELPLTPNPAPDTIVILSTRGNTRRAVRVGWFDFAVGKTACRLEATRLLEPGVGERDFGLFFRDRTSSKETYGLGRYVEAEPLAEGRYVLDFNRAYNPACAFSEHYNCPIPPKANELKVAIRAGEKDAHYLHH